MFECSYSYPEALSSQPQTSHQPPTFTSSSQNQKEIGGYNISTNANQSHYVLKSTENQPNPSKRLKRYIGNIGGVDKTYEIMSPFENRTIMKLENNQ